MSRIGLTAVLYLQMLIICDFDGTVTTTDTNSLLAKRFAAQRYDSLAGKLAKGELTVRETLEGEFLNLDEELSELIEVARQVPIRDGFKEFVQAASDAQTKIVLLSSGFKEFIEPILEHNGLLDIVPLIANEIRESSEGLKIKWRDTPLCNICLEHCKRHEVSLLRSQHEGLLCTNAEVVFIGDGFSDRCGADIADRIFARDSLATWLDQKQIKWNKWNDFYDITNALQLKGI